MEIVAIIIVLLITTYEIKGAINEYRHMKDAKRKAQIWDAHIK